MVFAASCRTGNRNRKVLNQQYLYHFIDARRRTDHRCDDFSDWLAGFGAEFEALRKHIAGIDPYFGNLAELRTELTQLFQAYFKEANA